MDKADQKSYDKLKKKLLRKFRFTVVEFRDKFRTSKPNKDESFGEFVTRLAWYFDRWLELGETKTNYEDLRDLIIREQVLTICNRDLRMFVEEREPSSVQEMSKLAEHFLQIHGKTYNNWSGSDAGRPDKSRSHFNDKPSSTKVTQGESSSYKHRTQSTLNNNPGDKKKACWICSSTDHMKNNCPMKDKFRGKSVKPALQCEEVAHVVLSDGTSIPMRLADDGKSIYTHDGQKVQITAFHSSIQENMPTIYGRVPGCDRDVLVLRDTGCSGAVIRQSLCKLEEFTGETQACLLMDGTICESPVVIKMIYTPYYSGNVRGITMPCPVYDVVAGNVEGARPADKSDPDWKPMDITEAGAVVTRAQSKLKPLTPLWVAKSSQLKVDGK